MDRTQAVDLLKSRLPEFAPVVDAHLEDNDELLIHLLMGDLGRFYMDRKADNEFRVRYWDAVELLASGGDEAVKNAVHVSLVEWFLAAPGEDADAFLASMQLQGPATAAMASHYLPQ